MKERYPDFDLRDGAEIQHPARRKDTNHSHRSATSGSTFAALRAGIQQANKTTNNNNAATAPYVHKSAGRTPNSKSSIHRVRAKAAGNPIATPTEASFKPCPTISLSTAPDCAPNAIRTPISCVRCVAVYDITP